MKLHSILFLIVFEFVNNYTNSKTNFYTTSKQLFANFKELRYIMKFLEDAR